MQDLKINQTKKVMTLKVNRTIEKAELAKELTEKMVKWFLKSKDEKLTIIEANRFFAKAQVRMLVASKLIRKAKKEVIELEKIEWGSLEEMACDAVEESVRYYNQCAMTLGKSDILIIEL